MEQQNLYVFVKVDLFLHEDGFTKLRELLSNSSEKLKPCSVISLSVEEGNKLTVKPFPSDKMNLYAIELTLNLGYAFLSVESLKKMLSLTD